LTAFSWQHLIYTDLKGENYLLTIAIDRYIDKSYPTLNNAKLDAERFHKVLERRYGFKLVQEPIFDEAANRKNIVEAINNLSNFLRPEDTIIIYYAGHGSVHPKTKKGYWIPNDAGTSVSDFVSNSTIIDGIEGIEAKHIFLISDSCFGGSFLSLNRDASDNHYKKLDELKSRWIFSSGRLEVVSDGQPGIGSPFALSLNDFLEKNDKEYFSASELMVAVSKATGTIAKQQPISAHIENVGHEGGQMVFKLADYNPVKQVEIDRELEKIVVTFDTAQKLQQIGLKEQSIFGFYKHDDGSIITKKIDGAKNFVCNAYSFEELSKFIPEHIEVDENTYLSRFDGYDKLTKEELESEYLDAEVTYQRTSIRDTPYMSICRCKGRMVAFSITDKGKYNNLICWGINQADTAGQMLIELFNEGKITSVK
jgi:hypothetical protein